MAISQHESLISKISTLRLHGLSRDAWRRFESSQRKQYDVIDIGYKLNLTDIQASIGLVQLSRLEEMQKRRTVLWDYYTNELADLGLQLPVLPSDPDSFHAKHLFSIVCQNILIGMNLSGMHLINFQLQWGYTIIVSPLSPHTDIFGHRNLFQAFSLMHILGDKELYL